MKSTDPATLTKSHQNVALLWSPPATPEQKAAAPGQKLSFAPAVTEKKSFEDGFLDEMASSHHFWHFGVEKHRYWPVDD